ncbi:MAG: serine hydrolase domain-containing protein [Halocynthiibacter sp.]
MAKRGKAVIRWTGLALVVVAGIAFTKREDIGRLGAVLSLFDADKITHNFSNMDQAFLSTPLSKGNGTVSPLPAHAMPVALPAGFDDFITDRALTSIVVLKDGQITHEAYYQGTSEDDLRISWSVAKSFLATLMGVVVAEGHIDSLDDPVVKYVPLLRGSAYEPATIRNVLHMSSGVKFNEDYLDFWSDINKMGRTIGLGGSLDEFAASITDTIGAPGEAWQYVSIDTHVIGMVIRGATGRSIPDLMSEKIIQPLGLEAAPKYLTDGEGVAFVLGGLNLTTRDYARFGQMILQGGSYNGTQIVSQEWIEESTRPSSPKSDGLYKYGYQWWIPADATGHEFQARGVYGQHIFIDTQDNIVIALTSSDKKFRENGAYEQLLAMLRSIVAAH